MWAVSTSTTLTGDVTNVNMRVSSRLVTVGRYHHGDLRNALVEEGLALARVEGAPGVVLREVARRVGVSHNAAYRHFGDRSELLHAIAERGMAMLVQAMEARLAAVPEDLAPVDRARRRLAELGRAYVEFALAEPGLFGVAFADQPKGDDPEADLAAETEGPFGMLNGALDDLVDVGYLRPERRPGAEVACWSAVHGFALLHLEGPLRVVPPAERDVALSYLVDALDAGLGVAPEVNDR